MPTKTAIASYKNQLDLVYGNTSFSIALIADTFYTIGFTLNESDLSQIYCPGHNFLNKNRVRFSNSLGSTLPTGMVTDQDYFVINKSTDYFQVSITSEGSPVTFTGLGSNDSETMSVSEQELDVDIDPLELWIKHEVNYFGSSRKFYTPGLALTGIVDSIPMAYTDPKTVLFSPVSAAITARYLLFIRDGSLTTGSIDGSMERVEDYESNFLIAAGETKGFIIGERKY